MRKIDGTVAFSEALGMIGALSYVCRTGDV